MGYDREMLALWEASQQQGSSDGSFGLDRLVGSFGNTINLIGNNSAAAIRSTPIPDQSFWQTIIQAETKDPLGYELGVCLHNPDVFGTKGFAALAIVQWGNGGANAIACLDYVNGMSFTLNASFIRICGIAIGLMPAGARVGAHIARGALGAPIHHPQRTLFNSTDVAPAGTSDFLIPPFAKRYRIVVEPGTAFQCDHLDSAGGSNSSFQVGANSQMDWESLQVFDTTIRVTNIGAANIRTSQAIFELSI